MLMVTKKGEINYVLPDLSEMEYVMFFSACEIAINKNYYLINLSEIRNKYNHHFLTNTEIYNFFESLNRKRYINRKIQISAQGKQEYWFTLTSHGLDFYLNEKEIRIDELVSEIKKVLSYTDIKYNSNELKTELIAKRINQPVFITNHILGKLKNENRLTLVKSIKGNRKLNNIYN